LQSGDAQVGQPESDYAGPGLTIEKVKAEVCWNGRGQFVLGNRPMEEQKILPILSHEGLQERGDHE
jgi:hypothetical protein